MDVRQLRHFAAVAETLHFGKAAERLHITQPPLSQSIMSLERELGAPLFTRTKRSVALTPFGTLWLDHVRQALDHVDSLADAAARLRDGRAGHLSLSFVTSADYSVLPSLVRRYAELYPDVEIRLTEATSDVQIPALLNGEVHAGIIIPSYDLALHKELSYHPLLREPLIAAVPEQWISQGRVALAGGDLDAAALLEAPLILFPPAIAPTFHNLVTDYYAAQGGKAKIVQQAIQMQTIISLVSAGMGLALVPASMRNLARAGVVYLNLPAPPILETGLAWRQENNTPTLRQFMRILDVARTDSVPGSAG